MNWEDGTLEAVRQQIRTPLPVPKPEPKFSAWSLVSAIPRGVAEAGAQVMASGVEVASAIQYRGMQPGSLFSLPEEAYQSDFADSLRNRGREFRPDPETAHAAEQVLYGFARGASKVIGGAVIAGPAGVVAAGGEEAMSAADDLKRQGVTDLGVRRQAGAVQGAGLALAALPVVGQTLKATAGLYAIGGPGGFMAQQALTRKILADAGFDQQAATFDPLDPVGLAVSTLVPGVFAAAGIRGQRKAAAAKAEAEFLAGPVPSERIPVAEAYSPEVVDAARVAYAVEQRAAANLDPGSLRSHDQHEAALSRAEEAIARGDPVQVADLIPEMTPAMREANLRAFMADSKVVDEHGAPLMVYHGTNEDIRSFDSQRLGSSTGDASAYEGFFFTRDAGEANVYARESAWRADPEAYAGGAKGGIYPVYLSMRNPMMVEYAATTKPEVIQAAKAAGHDGVIDARGDFVVFDPKQIKSATGNSGRFDPESASLTDPLTDLADAVRQLREVMNPGQDAAAQAQTAPPQGRAPEAAAPAQGKPRDLRAEVIALRKQTNVLNKLLECLNG